MTALSTLLDTYRAAGKSERERGTYFEELIVTYLRDRGRPAVPAVPAPPGDHISLETMKIVRTLPALNV